MAMRNGRAGRAAHARRAARRGKRGRRSVSRRAALRFFTVLDPLSNLRFTGREVTHRGQCKANKRKPAPGIRHCFRPARVSNKLIRSLSRPRPATAPQLAHGRLACNWLQLHCSLDPGVRRLPPRVPIQMGLSERREACRAVLGGGAARAVSMYADRRWWTRRAQLWGSSRRSHARARSGRASLPGRRRRAAATAAAVANLPAILAILEALPPPPAKPAREDNGKGGSPDDEAER